MKTSVLFSALILLLSLKSFSQIEFIGEHEDDFVTFVMVDDNMPKIYVAGNSPASFTLYNLDNSVYRQIEVPQENITGSFFIQFISRSLFDCDTNTVEYMICHNHMDPMSSVDNRWVKIMREDGTELFYQEDAVVYGDASTYMAQNNGTVRNNSSGAILRIGMVESLDPLPYKARFYQLCGSLPVMERASLLGDLTGLWENDSEGSELMLYPNPVNNGFVQFEMESTSDGTIRLFNMNGELVSQSPLNRESFLQSVDVSSMAAGIYLLNVELEDGTILNEKLVKVE
jgi:hypothetical protein